MESGEGAPVVTGAAREAGNYTFKIIFEGAGDDDRRWQELMVELEPLDCWFDVRSPRYIALSTSAANATAVAGYLERRGQRVKLQFETGRSQHSNPPPRLKTLAVLDFAACGSAQSAARVVEQQWDEPAGYRAAPLVASGGSSLKHRHEGAPRFQC